jgi:uncharacterized phiE125 gp8 family phage protein
VYSLTTITGPSAEPVTLAQAKVQLRIDHDDENALIESWIRSARELAEAHTGKRFVTQQVRMTLKAFPCHPDDVIRLPVGPVTAITGFTYTDEAGATQALAENSGYQAWLDHNPPLLAPPAYESWPTTKGGALKAVTVEFTAGTAVADVPGSVATAILLTLGYWDQNRGDGTEATNDPRALGLSPGALRLLDTLWSGAYR